MSDKSKKTSFPKNPEIAWAGGGRLDNTSASFTWKWTKALFNSICMNSLFFVVGCKN